VDAQANNPYAAPSAGSIVASGASIAPYAKVVRYAFPLSVAANLIFGAVAAFQFAFGLRRFALEYGPRVVALAASREYAASSAFGLTCLTAVIVVHRASRKGRVELENWGSLIVGGAIALLYPVNVACMLGGALIVMRAAYAMPASEWVASCARGITWADPVYGAATTVLLALLATLLLPQLLRVAVARGRRRP
jgi:ABC-type transporter Mla maintaining outer membrane lipid asymmetry permease subunit MlaE